MRRVIRAVSNLMDEMRRARSRCADGASFRRLCLDLMIYRLFLRQGRRFDNRERTIRFQGGIRLTYRCNPGDIWSVREVWLYDCYRLPFEIPIRCIVDLGANIGSTSVWLGKRYQAERLLAVEPHPANVDLARRNLEQNHVPAELVEAAVGPRDGTVRFEENDASNQGHVGQGELEVSLVSMETLLKRLPDDMMVDVLKLDIEGGEQDLLTENLGWLGRVRSLIVEFHPDRVDYPGLIAQVERAGFRYIPKESVFPDNMDAFLRDDEAGVPAAAAETQPDAISR